MTARAETGQVSHALAELCLAVEQFSTCGRIETSRWQAAYSAVKPAGHPMATSEVCDLAYLGALYSLGGAPLLGAGHFLVTPGAARVPPRVVALDGGVELFVPPSIEAPGDALAIGIGLGLETAKLQQRLGSHSLPSLALPSLEIVERLFSLPSESLVRAFGSVENATEALTALRVAPAERSMFLEKDTSREEHRSDDSPSSHDDVFEAFAKFNASSGPVMIVAGATERLHDLISPWARHFTDRLLQIAHSAHEPSTDPDAVYAALSAVFADDPGCSRERRQAEAGSGIKPVGNALVVEHENLDPTLADARCGKMLRDLQTNKALTVLTGRHPHELQQALTALGARVSSVEIIAESLLAPGHLLDPEVLIHPAGHALDLLPPLDAATSIHASMHIPSLGLAPSVAPGLLPGSSLNALAWPLAQTTVRARALGHIGRETQLAVTLHAPTSADMSMAALRALKRTSER